MPIHITLSESQHVYLIGTVVAALVSVIDARLHPADYSLVRKKLDKALMQVAGLQQDDVRTQIVIEIEKSGPKAKHFKKPTPEAAILGISLATAVALLIEVLPAIHDIFKSTTQPSLNLISTTSRSVFELVALLLFLCIFLIFHFTASCIMRHEDANHTRILRYPQTRRYLAESPSIAKDRLELKLRAISIAVFIIWLAGLALVTKVKPIERLLATSGSAVAQVGEE